MPTSTSNSEAVAVQVSFSADALTVVLDDGRTVSVPLVWFPRLLNASRKQKLEWEFIGGGIGIHWETIDEDISVASLLQPEKFMRMVEPNVRLEPRLLLPARISAKSGRRLAKLGGTEKQLRPIPRRRSTKAKRILA